jgi:hypothetical protein
LMRGHAKSCLFHSNHDEFTPDEALFQAKTNTNLT